MKTASLPAPWPDLNREAGSTGLVLGQCYLQWQRNAGEIRLDYGRCTSGQGSLYCYGNSQQRRFLVGDDQHPVAIAPCLADRPVVTRPQVPTELLPRQRVRLLVSTPLWLQIQIGEQLLLELPSIKLSDTWFGPHTRSGELCYAAQTRARLTTEQLPEDPLRAQTEVTLINHASTPLLLERLNLPVPNLPLYSDGLRFWTASLTIERSRDQQTAQVEIDPRPPQASRAAQQICAPRREIRGGVLNRAVEFLFA